MEFGEQLRSIIVIFSIVGLAMNAILIPIILYKNNRIQGKYQVLLINYRIISILICIAQFISFPVILIRENAILLFNSVERMHHLITGVCVYVHSSGYLCLTITAALSLFYRVLFLDIKQKKLFSKIGLVLMGSVTLAIGIAVAVLNNALPPEKDILKKMSAEIHNSTNLTTDQITVYGGKIFKDDGAIGNGLILGMTYSSVLFFFTLATCALTIVFCAKCDAPKSVVTKDLQQKLFIVLVLQILTPVIFSYLPALGLYGIHILMGSDPPSFSMMFMSFLPFAQAADPFWSLYLIPEYRNFAVPRINPAVNVEMTVHA